MWSEMVIYFIRWKVSNKKTSKEQVARGRDVAGDFFVARGGASLSDEQREEMTNREGVASGRATTIFSYKISHSKK